MNIFQKAIVKLVRFYQKVFSPAKIPCCRFTPTCSAYMIEAVKVHGALKGTALGIYRILRCNPLCKGGYDPVPPKKNRLGTKHKKIGN